MVFQLQPPSVEVGKLFRESEILILFERKSGFQSFAIIP
jgi:hypothetical protein